MKIFLLLLFFLLPSFIIPQVDSLYFNQFLVLTENNTIKIQDTSSREVFIKTFVRPYEYTADLDNDNFDELIVVDSMIVNDRLSFSIYLFDGDENLRLIDSIYSGSFFPFITYSDEINSIIIEAGNPEFEKFNHSNEFSSLPISLWKIDYDRLLLINDDVYEPFIFENNNLTQLLDYYSTEKGNSCEVSQSLKGLIASAFANFMNAGEHSLASQLLKKYYLCDDLEIFKQNILELIYPEAK